ncbi:MAG: ComEC/Rec2 family competence protein [Acidobacteriota bacterium]
MGSPSASSGFGAARFHAAPLFHAAWLFALGILVAHRIWIPSATLFVCIAIAVVLTIITVFRVPRLPLLPLALAWILLGAWCANMEPQPAPAPQLLAYSDGLLREVEGTVIRAGPVQSEQEQDVNSGAIDAPAQRIDLQLASIERVTDTEDAQVGVDGTVRLIIRWPDAAAIQRIRCGDRIRAVARLLPPQVYRDPGAWNRAAYLLDQGVTATASVPAQRIEARASAAHMPLGCILPEAQQAAGTRLLGLPAAMTRFPRWLRLSTDDAIMLSAMITGDRTFLSHALRAGFERTGSFHMLVVSGLHLAIVAGCIFFIARKLRIPRVLATVLTIAVSFAYALFTGFAAPVQRSLWMVSLYLIGRLVYRDRNALNLIGFAALCLLAASPRSLLEASFQMTLLAVVAIAGVAAPLLDAGIHPYVNATRDLRLVAADPKLPPKIAQFRVLLRMFAARLQAVSNRRIAWSAFPGFVRWVLRAFEALVVAVIVELAMTLPMAIYFHRVTLLALPANIFILPLLLLLVPAALVTLVVLLVWPAAATIPAAVTALLLHAGVGLVHAIGDLRLSDVRLPAPPPFQVAVFIALLAAAFVLARAGRPWVRRIAWLAMAAAGFAAVAPRAVQHPRNALLVEAIDVGQGDSLLLITPEGKTMLVDAGGFGGGPRTAPQQFDIGEEVVSAALWSRGIRHLDVVALSHAHSDHMGGMPAVLRNFHPDELWVGNNPLSEAYRSLLDQAAEEHIQLRRLVAGDQLTLGSTRVRVLAPAADYQPGAEPANNDSLVLHVAYRDTSVLLEGDAEAPIERTMLSEPDLGSQLLKVAHHGSATSTQPAFLARVAPQWAVISCGQRNRYGHPRMEVLNELQSAGVRTASTDAQGAVCFRLDGRIAQHESSCATDQMP